MFGLARTSHFGLWDIMPPISLKYATPRSRVKYSTTEPLALPTYVFESQIRHKYSINVIKKEKYSMNEKTSENEKTVKPELRGHSKIDKTKVLMSNGSLMKVKSIAECSKGSTLQYF